jgi:hypothetical protein
MADLIADAPLCICSSGTLGFKVHRPGCPLAEPAGRVAIAKGDLATVRRYLPANYTADPLPGSVTHVVIYGDDSHGWTLDGYVIPRLASGMIYAREVED